MTPAYNHTDAQKTILLSKNEIAKTTVLQNITQKEEGHFSVVAMPQEINDPAQWDEAWFANYE